MNTHVKSTLLAALKWLPAALVFLLAPIKVALLCTVGLVLIDTVTGVLAARKRGEKLTSHGFRRVVAKVVVYGTGILTMNLADRFMGLGELVPHITSLATALVAIAELTSINENLGTLNGGVSPFQALIDRLHGPATDKVTHGEDEP